MRKKNFIAGCIMVISSVLLVVQYIDFQNQKEEAQRQEEARYEEQNANADIELAEKEVVQDGMRITLTNQMVTSELIEGAGPDEIIYFDEPHDEDGTLEDGYQYVFLELEWENLEEDTREIYINGMLLCSYLQEDEIWNGYSPDEMRYKSTFHSKGKDYFREEFAAHEKRTITVAWIIKESEFYKYTKRCLAVSLTGDWQTPSNIKYINLEGKL